MFCDHNTLRGAIAAAGVLAATGCGNVPEGTWATRLPEADAWLAITVQDGNATAFVCGDETRLDLSRWMTDFADDALKFELAGVTLSVDINDELAVGTLIDPDGVAVSVNAPRIDGQGLAGLYTAEDSGARDGLILLPAGADEPDGLGVWRDSLGNVAQVTPVRPIELVDLGIEVTADTDVGMRDFFMTLVEPASIQQ